MSLVHLDHDTGAVTVKTMSDFKDLAILADKKDVIMMDRNGKVFRFTPSNGEQREVGSPEFDSKMGPDVVTGGER